MSAAKRSEYLRDWEMRLEHAEQTLYGTSDGDLNYGQDHYEHVRLPSDERKSERRLLKLKNGGYAWFDIW